MTFAFKQFQVQHGASTMRVSTDSVAFACAVSPTAPKNVLEIGTGCGVISLILAQRFPESNFLAIDIDKASVKEAQGNFANSPFRDRLRCIKCSFAEAVGIYDYICTNPPFFKNDLLSPNSSRNKARHEQGYSLYELLEKTFSLLQNEGELAILFPYFRLQELLDKAQNVGFFIKEITQLSQSELHKPRTVFVEFKKGYLPYKKEKTIHIKNSTSNQYTQDYRKLTFDFYLDI